MAKKLTNMTDGTQSLSDKRNDGVYRKPHVIAQGKSVVLSDEEYRNLKTFTLTDFSIETVVDDVIDTKEEVQTLVDESIGESVEELVQEKLDEELEPAIEEKVNEKFAADLPQAIETAVTAKLDEVLPEAIDAQIAQALSNLELSKKTFPANYYFAKEYGSVQAAYDKAVEDGHNTSNPAFVLITESMTGNVNVAIGGINFVGLCGHGLYNPITITGKWTFNGSSTSTFSNYFLLRGFQVRGAANEQVINFAGTNGQKLHMSDMWVASHGGVQPAIKAVNTSTDSVIKLDNVKFGSTGTNWLVELDSGKLYTNNLETSGTVGIVKMGPNTDFTTVNSELDANSDSAFELAAGAKATLLNSFIDNAKANSIGVNMIGAGATLTVLNTTFDVPNGTGRAVEGIAGTVLAYNGFIPVTNANVNPLITVVQIPSTPTIA